MKPFKANCCCCRGKEVPKVTYTPNAAAAAAAAAVAAVAAATVCRRAINDELNSLTLL